MSHLDQKVIIDCIEQLKKLDDESIQTIVTSHHTTLKRLWKIQ